MYNDLNDYKKVQTNNLMNMYNDLTSRQTT